MHMVAARLGFEKTMVGTRWATPRPDCMDRLRKHYSHLAEGWFLARKAAWSLSGCMATNSADYWAIPFNKGTPPMDDRAICLP